LKTFLDVKAVEGMRVVRVEDVKEWEIFLKVKGKVLLSGSKLMFLLVKIESEGVVPEHSHPHEQMGLCLKGKAEFKAGGGKEIVEAGMTYWFRSNEKHSVKVVGGEPAVFLDVFSPPREDYLKKQNQVALSIK
jgi:quercetin dioxygenase-like cupin family protein